MRTSVIGAVVISAGAVLALHSAWAQNSSPLSTPGPRNCPPGVSAPPLGSNDSRPLSEQLSESKGVICPPAGIDPGLATIPPPGSGKITVIPPPGTPGGDPKIVPK
jgi:hypothetical protein